MSTTEESDWEASGPYIRAQSEPFLPGPEPPSIPPLKSDATLRRSQSPMSGRHRASSEIIVPIISTEYYRKDAAEVALAPSESISSTIPRPFPLPSNASPSVAQGDPGRAEGSNMDFNYLIPSQDVDATPSQRAFMARINGRGGKISRGGRVSRGGRGSRGGRPPKIQIEPPREDGDLNSFAPRKVNKGGRPRGSRAGQSSGSSTRGVNRGGRPRGSRGGVSASKGGGGVGRGGQSILKRKRKHDGNENEQDGNSDSSEEITSLPTQSRSGRRITQVVTPIPIGSELESSLKPPGSLPFFPYSDPTSSGQKRAKRKRVTLSAVCKNCGRGHSPQSNQIVFCDGCNTPWHQYCHDRPITPTVIKEEEKEWHCGDCEVQAEEASYMIGRIPPAEGMGLAEKRRALEGMARAELVALLLRASSLYPNLPILKPPPPPETWTAATAAPISQVPEVKGEVEYEFYNEPLPYPRAGNGVRLPPEEEDVELLIDEDIKPYSHSWMDGKNWIGSLADTGTQFNLLRPASLGVKVGA